MPAATTAVRSTYASLPVPMRRSPIWSVPQVRWAGVATALFAAGVVAQLSGAPEWLRWVWYLACYLTGGWEPTVAGLQALRDKILDVDLLMIVAAIGAAAIGQIFDGALLIVIFATSGALEAVATRRTEDSVRGLLDLAPAQATRLTPDAGEEIIDAVELAVGDEILIRPGERIGADGTVTDGLSDVDQASITGEPMPVAKSAGDDVFAGTLNGVGALRVLVTREPSQTVIARIVALVTEASATKAKAQLFIEKVEQRYSVGVVVATLALFFIPLIFGAALQPTLLRAMTFMIVASPCAVVLATMPPLLSAIANAGRHGVLVKSAVVMERLGDTTLVAFDKTGTLSEGRAVLAEIRILDHRFDESAVLRLVASAEQSSQHPIGRALVTAAHQRGVQLQRADEFTSHPGRGIRARVGGRRVDVSRPTEVLAGQANPVVTELEVGGRTVVVVSIDDRLAAVVALEDRVRALAAETVAELTALTGAAPALLTGDNGPAASYLAQAVGISDVRAALQPHEKAAAVRDLESHGAKVLLVGDGVNDAPALATAYSGIAMGRAGSDLALETADAVIVRDDLSTIPAVIALSRRARRTVITNLVIAAAFITVLVGWDLFGHLPLPLGVAGHEGSTMLVGLNGLRLLRNSAWRRASSRSVRRRCRLPGR
jgi:cation-transporting P-type ATPase J